MAHPRKFRFGVQLSTAPSGEAWAAVARKAEDLGYSTLFMPDHFGDQLAPVPALMAAADATTTLRVGALVLDNDYKHPVVLAKEAATIDVLSGGRLEFGIGAGWMNTDYEQSGIPKDRDGVRIARMAEALEVYKGLWADGAYSFSGEHYTITELDGLPKPVQQPHPPILIGGGGPKVLGIAGRHADIVGINPSIPKGYVDASAAQDTTPERVDQKVQWLRDGAGDRFDDLELNVLVFAHERRRRRRRPGRADRPDVRRDTRRTCGRRRTRGSARPSRSPTSSGPHASGGASATSSSRARRRWTPSPRSSRSSRGRSNWQPASNWQPRVGVCRASAASPAAAASCQCDVSAT